jgi:hypothetical protein
LLPPFKIKNEIWFRHESAESLHGVNWKKSGRFTETERIQSWGCRKRPLILSVEEAEAPQALNFFDLAKQNMTAIHKSHWLGSNEFAHPLSEHRVDAAIITTDVISRIFI